MLVGEVERVVKHKKVPESKQTAAQTTIVIELEEKGLHYVQPQGFTAVTL